MTTANTTAARRVSYQLETLWDYDYIPTHEEIETLYGRRRAARVRGAAAARR